MIAFIKLFVRFFSCPVLHPLDSASIVFVSNAAKASNATPVPPYRRSSPASRHNATCVRHIRLIRSAKLLEHHLFLLRHAQEIEGNKEQQIGWPSDPILLQQDLCQHKEPLRSIHGMADVVVDAVCYQCMLFNDLQCGRPVAPQVHMRTPKKARAPAGG